MVDDVVGQVMKLLKEKNIVDNTLLIFTSDNGPEQIAYPRIPDYGHYSMGDLRGLKRDLWEGGSRVPYVVRWPEEIKPGRECDEIIGTTDLLATVAAITGSELPEDAGELFNLKDDLSELKNRYAEHPEKVKEFKALLQKYKTQGRSAPRP